MLLYESCFTLWITCQKYGIRRESKNTINTRFCNVNEMSTHTNKLTCLEIQQKWKYTRLEVHAGRLASLVITSSNNRQHNRGSDTTAELSACQKNLIGNWDTTKANIRTRDLEQSAYKKTFEIFSTLTLFKTKLTCQWHETFECKTRHWNLVYIICLFFLHM